LITVAAAVPAGDNGCIKRVITKTWGCSAVGARFLGMEEAAGSTPASSTILFYQ
jgi:hypothetical protein